MRVYGRTYDENGKPSWQVVTTDANGFNDYVYATALIQCFLLNLLESPFWADWGIPAEPSVLQQVPPDYYVTIMQQRYAPYFANLMIGKTNTGGNPNTPAYSVQITTQQGVKLAAEVPA